MRPGFLFFRAPLPPKAGLCGKRGPTKHQSYCIYIYICFFTYTLGLQVPSEKVFGVGLEGPKTI